MRYLLNYSWPGNVRELANVIEYAVAVAHRETILPEDLLEEIRRPAADIRNSTTSRPSPGGSRLPEHLHITPAQQMEAGKLRSALDINHWKRAETARALGISRATLWRCMRELHLA